MGGRTVAPLRRPLYRSGVGEGGGLPPKRGVSEGIEGRVSRRHTGRHCQWTELRPGGVEGVEGSDVSRVDSLQRDSGKEVEGREDIEGLGVKDGKRTTTG